MSPMTPEFGVPAPAPQPTPGRGVMLGVPVGAVVLIAVVTLVLALVVGSSPRDGAAQTIASGPTAVSLSEFKISPATINATTGGGLHVTNAGTVQHNLAIDGTTLATAMLDPGATAHLDLSSLSPGDYTVYCQASGHRDAGMTAKLHVTASSSVAGSDASGGASGATTSTTMSSAEMDQMMADSIKTFPAKTAGLGAQDLTAQVLPDGTKEFDITAQVVQWEVSPGKKVEAWAYNGTVPGPTIRVNPGDRVKIVLHNKLPESTSIHFHGLTTPNAMDGTPFVTQPVVKPGTDYTYEWTVQSTPAVGMYHSHEDAVKQVPDGLAGAFIVGNEPIPASLGVAQAQVQQQIMMLNDSGTLSYTINGKSFPATAPIVAKQGSWLEVQYMNEGTQIHPMHLHGMPQIVIAKDGYPLANPEYEDTILVAPGERYTVLVHATELGTWVWHCHILTHAETSTGMFGMVTALVVQP